MDCPKCRASMQTTLEKDVNISDLKPDALKLIMDKGNAAVDEVRVSSDHVTVRGRLQFKILYLTDGEKRKAEQMEGEIPFTEEVYLSGVKSGDRVEVSVEVEDLTTTLIHSRKCSVQSLLLIKAECPEMRDEEAAVDIGGQEKVEYRKKTLSIAPLVLKRTDIFKIREEIEIPGSFPNIGSLIWWETECSQVEFKLLQDKISVQGEIRAFFLYRGDGEEEESCHYETTVPFAGTLDCDGAEETMIPEISYQLQIPEMTVKPDFDGEERVFAFELWLPVDISAYEEEQAEILSDVYGVVQEAAVREKEVPFRQFSGRSSGKCKLSAQVKPEEEEGISRILHTRTGLQLGEPELKENGIEVTGAVNITILYESSSEAVGLGTARVSIPFTYTMETQLSGKDYVYPVTADVEQLGVSLLDAGEMDVKCVVFFRTNIYREWTEKIVEEVTLEELDSEKLDSLPGIVIYAVRPGESLWDIGKRYYVPVSAIRQTNDLSGDEVKTGDRLLIVR
jgi:LysM repeat protein